MRSALSKLRLADRRGRNMSLITTTFSSHAAGDGDSTPESIPTDTPRSISSPISLPPSPLPPHTPRSIPSPISLPPSPLTTPSELEERRRSLYLQTQAIMRRIGLYFPWLRLMSKLFRSILILSKLSSPGYNAVDELAIMKKEKNMIERATKTQSKKDLAAKNIETKKEVEERHKREAEEAKEMKRKEKERKRIEKEKPFKKINEVAEALTVVVEAQNMNLKALQHARSKSQEDARKLKALNTTKGELKAEWRKFV